MNKEMNAKQNVKLNMYRAAEKHVNDNASIIVANPAFQAAFNKFKANIAAVASIAQQKSATLTGIAADKNSPKQTLCKLAGIIADVTYTYASANFNNTMKDEMNLPVTTLLRTRHDALAPRCQNIHDRGATNLSALKDYSITAAMPANLQAAIDNYSTETMKPRDAKLPTPTSPPFSK